MAGFLGVGLFMIVINDRPFIGRTVFVLTLIGDS